MKKFIGSTSVTRMDLLEGKTTVFKMLISEFLDQHRFNTEYGANKINTLLKDHKLTLTDDGILLFLQKVAGDNIGILVFQDMDQEEEYNFYLVSGSTSEIERMSKDIKDDTKQDEDADS